MYETALKAMKEKSGMTLDAIAKASGVPTSSVSRILSGETEQPSIKTVADIVKAMGGSLDDVVGISHAAPPQKSCEGERCTIIQLYERQRVSDEQWRTSMMQQHEQRVEGIKTLYENRIESIERKYMAQLEVKDRWIKSLMLCTGIALIIISVIVVADLLLADIGFIRR